MRALDKFDRLGARAVGALLGKGRKDESGDFTTGADLDAAPIKVLQHCLSATIHEVGAIHGLEVSTTATVSSTDNDGQRLRISRQLRVSTNAIADALRLEQGIDELNEIADLSMRRATDRDRIRIDPSVVRGLEYYTGPVFEAELTFEVKDEKGNPVRFGSVGGGGRYDDLVARFTGQKVPATGFSIGVSRLQAALAVLNKDKADAAAGPVIVTVMEKDRIADYQKLVQTLRAANIRAELYLGNPKKFGKQLEYADKRGSPCVVIQGSDEKAKGEVLLKDMIEGAKAAAAIADNKEWKETRPAQVSVKEADLVAEVQEDPRPPQRLRPMLARRSIDMPATPNVEITFCRLCGWGLRAGWMAQELLQHVRR